MSLLAGLNVILRPAKLCNPKISIKIYQRCSYYRPLLRLMRIGLFISRDRSREIQRKASRKKKWATMFLQQT